MITSILEDFILTLWPQFTKENSLKQHRATSVKIKATKTISQYQRWQQTTNETPTLPNDGKVQNVTVGQAKWLIVGRAADLELFTRFPIKAFKRNVFETSLPKIPYTRHGIFKAKVT